MKALYSNPLFPLVAVVLLPLLLPLAVFLLIAKMRETYS